METLLTTIHVTACVLLVLVVLLQSGKGAEVSASFGGSSQTVFGSSGGANFFTRFTAGCATVFMLTSILLTIQGTETKDSVFEGIEEKPAQSTPATTQKTEEKPGAKETPAAPQKK